MSGRCFICLVFSCLCTFPGSIGFNKFFYHRFHLLFFFLAVSVLMMVTGDGKTRFSFSLFFKTGWAKETESTKNEKKNLVYFCAVMRGGLAGIYLFFSSFIVFLISLISSIL